MKYQVLVIPSVIYVTNIYFNTGASGSNISSYYNNIINLPTNFNIVNVIFSRGSRKEPRKESIL